jgi:hypothetical protein
MRPVMNRGPRGARLVLLSLLSAMMAFPTASAVDRPVALAGISARIATLAMLAEQPTGFQEQVLGIMRDLAAYPEADLPVHRVWQEFVAVVLRQGIPEDPAVAFQVASEFLALPWPEDEATLASESWVQVRLRDTRLGVAFLSLCRAALIPAPAFREAISDPVIPPVLLEHGRELSAINREVLPSADLRQVYDGLVEEFRQRDLRIARQQELLGVIQTFSGALQRFLERRYALGSTRFEELNELMLVAGFDLARRKTVFSVVMKATGKKPADFLVTGMSFEDKAGF